MLQCVCNTRSKSDDPFLRYYVHRCHIKPTWLLEHKVEKIVTRGIARFREISCDLLDLIKHVAYMFKELAVKM